MINELPIKLLGLSIRSEEFKQEIENLGLDISISLERTRVLDLRNGISINIDLNENVMSIGALLKNHGVDRESDLFRGKLPIQHTQLTRNGFKETFGKPLRSENYSNFLGQEIFPFDEYPFNDHILHLRFDKDSNKLVLIAIKNVY